MTTTPTLIEIAPGLFRVRKDAPEPKRSDLPVPNVISDTMPETEQIDGQYYTSKAKFRAVGKANGLIEVGNDPARFKPKRYAPRDTKVERRRVLERVVAEYRQGRRPKR